MPKTKKYSTHNNMTYHSQLNMWQSDSARFRRGSLYDAPHREVSGRTSQTCAPPYKSIKVHVIKKN